MAEREWLVAENRMTSFALPREAVVEMLSEAGFIPLPFSSAHISGIFLHKGKVIPLFKENHIGFTGVHGDLLILDKTGESLALPVNKIIGFTRCQLEENLEEPMPKPFLGQISFRERKVPVLEIEELYKLTGFI
jgi:chemotaxis signal transduction protein